MPRSLIVSTLIVLFTAAGGCQQQEDIRHYTVPKQSQIDRLAAESDATTEPDQAGEPQRMLAAIVLRPSQGWFFKLMGPQDEVNAHGDEFSDFLKSVHFQDDSAPEWSLPAGWTRQPGNQFRFATLAIDGSSLEVSVSTLPRGDVGQTEYVLSNVNRWRGQLGLEGIAPNELDRESVQTQLNGDPAFVVDLVGTAQANSMAAPFASRRPLAAPPAASAGAAQPLKYEVPAGWQEIPASGFSKASFRVDDGGQQADVTVSDLPASANELLPNVNRWRGQLGLEPTTERDVQDHVETIRAGSREGQYIELSGGDKATFAAMIQAGGRAWFIKLFGDKEVVERERTHFKSFIQSLSIGDN